MASVTVITREGDRRDLSGEEGASLMEIIRAEGVDEMLALCGGCCSCATCHVYVDQSFLDRMPALSDDENELLESSSHRNERSRLACQIPFTAALDGARVTIAPED